MLNNALHSTPLLKLMLLIALWFGLVQGLVAGHHAEQTEPGDLGKQPWVFDIRGATLDNANYRNTRWTGQFFQMVLMSLEPGEVIDLEVHDDHDQFFRVEAGTARVLMGKTADEMSFDETAGSGYGIMIPAGYWHKIENAGDEALKVYTFYAPAEHPAGTIHGRSDGVLSPAPYEEAL